MIGTTHPGSSPLTRGKLFVRRFSRGAARLIPAHAGKTAPPEREGPGAKAHPRSRGENPVFVYRTDLGCGSSPLTRGKLLARLDSGIGERLIPAHAGKTRAA